jgi:hypothetical protein
VVLEEAGAEHAVGVGGHGARPGVERRAEHAARLVDAMTSVGVSVGASVECQLSVS